MFDGFDDDRRDTAQICLNGHVINPHYESSPDFNQDFCSTCGERTTTVCLECKGRIPGHRSLLMAEMEAPPAYCTSCGKPFPWTAARLEALRELAEEAETLDSEEKQQLKDSLEHLVRETPKTEVAVRRFKRLAAKAGREFGSAARAILTDLVSETIKKALWGGGA